MPPKKDKSKKTEKAKKGKKTKDDKSVKTAMPSAKEEVNMQLFASEFYTVGFVVPSTKEDEVFLQLFIKGCDIRERRAIVAITKKEILSRFPKEEQKVLEDDQSALAREVQRRIYERLCEVKEILAIFEKKQEEERNHIKDYCPEEGAVEKAEKSEKGKGKDKGKKSKDKGKSKEKAKGKDKGKDKGSKKVKGDKKKGSKSDKSDKSDKTEESGKSKREKKIPETTQRDVSKIPKRGAEVFDRDYVIDEPGDGPKLYIALCGFYDQTIIKELQNLQVPIDFIVKMQQASESPPPTPGLSAVSSIDDLSIDLTIYPEDHNGVLYPQYFQEHKEMHTIEKKETVDKNELLSEIQSFWSRLENERFDQEKSAFLKQTAIVDYMEPDMQVELYNKGIIQKQTKIVYDEVCLLLYDIYDTMRQQKNYIDHIKELDVTETNTNVIEDIPSLQIFNDVPWEHDTVPCFLHCIISRVSDHFEHMFEEYPGEGITHSELSFAQESDTNRDELNFESSKEEEDDEEEENPIEHPKRKSTRNLKKRRVIEAKIKKLNNMYGLCDEHPFLHEFDVNTQQSNPILLTFGNDIQFTAMTINNTNVISAHFDMIRKLIFAKICARFPNDNEMMRLKYSYHINKIFSFVKKKILYPDMVRRLLNMLVFDQIAFQNQYPDKIDMKWRQRGIQESLSYDRSTSCPELLENQEAMQSLAELIRFESDSKVNYKSGRQVFECPEIAYLIDDYDVIVKHESSSLLKYLQDYMFSEPMKPEVLFQFLLKAYTKFNYVDYEYYPPSDSMLLRFHNPNTIASVHEWKGRLITKVCVRDFFDYVLDEEREWLEKEESKRDAELNKSEKTDETEGQTEEEQEIDELLCPSKEMLLSGSIKQQVENDKVALEAQRVLELAQAEEAENAKLKKGAKPGKVGKGAKGGKTPTEKSIKSKSDKSGKDQKDEGGEGKTKKKIKGAKGEPEIAEAPIQLTNENKEEVKKDDFKFIGYNLGDTRLQVSGKDTTFYAVRCKIHVNVIDWTYGENHVSIEVNINDQGLYYTCPLGPLYQETIPSFHVILKNNMIIAFSKMHFKKRPIDATIELQPIDEKSDAKPEKKLNGNDKNNKLKRVEISDKVNTADENTEEAKSKEDSPNEDEVIQNYSLEISMQCSWPNGLTIQTIDRQIKPYLIRQILPQQTFTQQTNAFGKQTSDGINHFPSTSECLKKMNFQCKPEFLIKYRKERQRVFSRSGFITVYNEDGSILIHTPHSAQYWIAADDAKLCSNKESVFFRTFNDYLYVSARGYQQTVVDKKIIKSDKLLFRCAHDYMRSEIFMRRSDGTNSFLNRDSLIVTFNDGTRITTTCHIEECSQESEEDDAESTGFDYSPDADATTPAAVPVLKKSQEPWVSVILISKMEHPDYATVIYDELSGSVLEMPGDVNIKIRPDGYFTAEMDKKTKLYVSSDEVSMRSSVCNVCPCVTAATIYFAKDDDPCIIPKYILKVKDCCRRRFYVTSEGKCIWDKKSDAGDIAYDPSVKECCRQQPAEEMQQFYIIQRNLEGERLCHKSDVEMYKSEAEANHSIFRSTDSGSECLQIFSPFEKENLKYWHLPQVPIASTNFKQKDCTEERLLELWGGPFSIQHRRGRRHSHGMRNKRNPVAKQSTRPPFAYIVRHICALPENSVELIRRALASYRKWCLTENKAWNKRLNLEVEVPLQQRLEINAENAISNFKTTIFAATGCTREVQDKFKDVGMSPNLLKYLQKRQQEMALEDMYRKAIREHIVPPYFKLLEAGGNEHITEVLRDYMESLQISPSNESTSSVGVNENGICK